MAADQIYLFNLLRLVFCVALTLALSVYVFCNTKQNG